jgi:hypothetical protein
MKLFNTDSKLLAFLNKIMVFLLLMAEEKLLILKSAHSAGEMSIHAGSNFDISAARVKDVIITKLYITHLNKAQALINTTMNHNNFAHKFTNQKRGKYSIVVAYYTHLS